MSLLEKFIASVHANKLFTSRDHLLLAVSGGVDSVVLCELCHQAGFTFTIAHCNFRLRGAESDRDEHFVTGLGMKYNVEVLVKRFETEAYAFDNKLSIQEAARELRYNWFGALVESQNSKVKSQNPLPSTSNSFLLTAHHADDNNETLLMNFFRGTGLHGLTGIPETNGYIRRPLLGFDKEELMAFAAEHKLEFVEDSSNESSKYTRNFFRNELIPAISNVYPQVKQNLQDNINRFRESEKLYLYAVNELKKKLCRSKGAEVHIPVKQLLMLDNRALVYEIIREYGFGEKQVEELYKLTSSESGKYIDSPSLQYRIIKHRHWLIISPVQSTASATIAISSEDRSVVFEAGTIHLQASDDGDRQPPLSLNEAWLDQRLMSYPLILRKWKTGDYFYPLGMKKKKKLSRFFIDLKMSKADKEKVWVLETNKRIAWVIGYRIDDRFKLSPATRTVIKCSIQPGY
jgi:tRNA(Ile)-lysidine synthase